jgi:hypothetical protein
MTRRVFFLAHTLARRNAMKAVADAPDGYMVVIGEPKRKDAQNAKMHAMIEEIAAQSQYAGKSWDADDMKRILVDEFADELRKAGSPLHHDSRLIPSENGTRIIQLGIQTSQFYVREAAAFIEFLYAWGTVRNVVFTEVSEQ